MDSGTVGTVASGAGNTISARRCRSWFFTLANPESDIKDKFPKEAIYIYQLEKGEGGLTHYQGCVRFANPVKFATVKEILEGAHWETCKSWKESVKYCQKEETRIEGPFTNYPKLLKSEKKQKFEIIIEIPKIELRPWQTLVEWKIQHKADDREIIWIYGTIGNEGKTFFARYLAIKYPNNISYVLGKPADMKYAISERIQRKEMAFPHCIILDVPRADHTGTTFPYAGIEELKGGIFFSSKFKSTTCVYPHIHIIVFANFYPDVASLSRDRWVIINLNTLY